MAYEEFIESGKETRFQSGERAANIGRIGGINSGKTRRRKATVKQAMDWVLSLPVTDAKLLSKLKEMGVEDADNQTAVIVGLFSRAAKGDPKAAALIFEYLDDENGSTEEQTESHNALIEAIRKRNNED